jgi:hypothetical protein
MLKELVQKLQSVQTFLWLPVIKQRTAAMVEDGGTSSADPETGSWEPTIRGESEKEWERDFFTS